MPLKHLVSFLSNQFSVLLITISLCVPSYAQAPERTPYSAPDNWTVTTYRASGTKAFLRCSAERHYGDGLTLTIAKNVAGKFVLGFTSSDWKYEDRSTPTVSIQIDAGESVSLPGRVRLLPTGPIVFVDIEENSSIVTSMSLGSALHVRTAETSLEFSLAGAEAAVSGVNQCQSDGTE
jgi:hypothetical protein